MPSNHLILWRPLLLLPSIIPSIRVFSNESVLHIMWPKDQSFSFSISPFLKNGWFFCQSMNIFQLGPSWVTIQRELCLQNNSHQSKNQGRGICPPSRSGSLASCKSRTMGRKQRDPLCMLVYMKAIPWNCTAKCKGPCLEYSILLTGGPRELWRGKGENQKTWFWNFIESLITEKP